MEIIFEAFPVIEFDWLLPVLIIEFFGIKTATIPEVTGTEPEVTVGAGDRLNTIEPEVTDGTEPFEPEVIIIDDFWLVDEIEPEVEPEVDSILTKVPFGNL